VFVLVGESKILKVNDFYFVSRAVSGLGDNLNNHRQNNTLVFFGHNIKRMNDPKVV